MQKRALISFAFTLGCVGTADVAEPPSHPTQLTAPQPEATPSVVSAADVDPPQTPGPAPASTGPLGPPAFELVAVSSQLDEVVAMTKRGQLFVAGMKDGAATVVTIADDGTVAPTTGLPADGSRPIALVGYSGADSIVYLGMDSVTDGGPVFEIPYDGDVWTPLLSKLPAGLSAMNEMEGVVAAAISDSVHGGLYWFDSENSNDLYRPVAENDVFYDGRVVDLGWGQRGYLIDSSGLGLFESPSNDGEWTVVPWSVGREIAAFLAKPLLVATKTPDAIWRSDDGQTFTKVHDSVVSAFERDPTAIYAAAGNDVLHSADGGMTFEPSSGLPTDGRVRAIESAAPDLWVAVERGGAVEIFHADRCETPGGCAPQ